jgi:Glycosyl hydrolases family 28
VLLEWHKYNENKILDSGEFLMIRILKEGLIVSLVIIGSTCSLLQGRMWDVREFGAVGDKQTNDGPMIQKAIEACVKAGGGTVYIPAGDYFCGGLQLKSNVTLYLEAGATLWVSAKEADYPHGRRFLYAEDEKHITIEGRGTIHGTGEEDLLRKKGDKRKRASFRVGILRFNRCRNVTIDGITVKFSDSWTFDFEFCENVFVNGVSILNNYYRVNADGIDPVSCKNVHISNCHIVAGDDCIVCKTREGQPCEDVVVTNCTLESVATAVKLGTESPADFRNIIVSNCVIRNSSVGIGIYLKDGATAERITFANCSIETIRDSNAVNTSTRNSVYPIFVDIEKRNKDSRLSRIRDLTFADINIVSDNGILVQGMSKSKIENLTLRNITLRVDRGFDYAERKKHVGGRTEKTEDRRRTENARQPAYATLANIEGLTVDRLRVLIPEEVFAKYPRRALSLHKVDKALVSNVWRVPAGFSSQSMPKLRVGMPPEAVVAMDNCRNSWVTKCLALPSTETFLQIRGNETQNLSVAGNEFSMAKKGVDILADVPKEAIRD